MKKRSAMAIAAGLVAALLTGAVALSFGLSGAQTADATGERATPRVRTVHRTVTVHREAKATEPETVTVVTASSSSPTASDGSSENAVDDDSGDEAFEDDGDGFQEPEDEGEHGAGYEDE